jgi:CHAD domain-containing protein
MLKKKRQLKYLNKRWANMHHHLQTFSNDGGQETIHKLRVEIKKVRAFTQFSHALRGQQLSTADLKKIKRIFKHAGMIRDAYTSLLTMKRYRISNTVLRSEEAGIIKNEAGKFRTLSGNYNKRISKADKTFHKKVHAVKNNAIKHWFGLQLRIIASALGESSVYELHPARKRIKTLLYILAILPEKMASGLRLNTTYLNKLQDAIGQWHDHSTATALLIGKTPKGKTMVAKLQEEEHKTLQEVRKLSADFLSKALVPLKTMNPVDAS